MSLFSSLNRDFSKDRDFGREVSSVGDVSSMKSKTVCAFYCLNFALFLWTFMCDLLSCVFLSELLPETSSLQKSADCT